MNNLKKFAKYLAIPAVLLLMAIPLTGATSNAIYLHHQRLTLANLEADLQNREIGLDFENKTIVGRYADGTYVHLLSAEQPNVTIGGTLGVVGPITGSSTLTLSTLTANKPLFTNGSSVVTTAGVTGYGTTVVLDSLPTLKSPTISGTVPGTVGFTSGTFSGTLGITGNFAVNTNKFNVTASTGNTAVAGTFGALGAGTFGSGSGNAQLVINGGAGQNRELLFQSNGSARWYLNVSSTAESGSDAGSNLSILARTDGGSAIDAPISITRAAGGAVTIPRPLTLSAFSSGRIPYFGTGGAVSQDNIYWDATNDRLGIGSGASSPSNDLHVKKTSAGSSVQATITNVDNTNGSSHAVLKLEAGGGSGGDAYTISNNNVVEWSAGLDNSDGDAYVITPSGTPGGATNGLKITTGGAVSMPGTLALGGNEAFTYDEGSFTVTITGCTSAPTATAYFVRMGKAVTLMLPNLTGTSNSTALSFTGLPASIQPASTQTITVKYILDNSIQEVSGSVSVASSNVLFNRSDFSPFTASGTKGLNSVVTVSYTLY